MRRDRITFTVFKRSQGKVFYARFKDTNGKRTKEVSTGQTAKVRVAALLRGWRRCRTKP